MLWDTSATYLKCSEVLEALHEVQEQLLRLQYGQVGPEHRELGLSSDHANRHCINRIIGEASPQTWYALLSEPSRMAKKYLCIIATGSQINRNAAALDAPHRVMLSTPQGGIAANTSLSFDPVSGRRWEPPFRRVRYFREASLDKIDWNPHISMC